MSVVEKITCSDSNKCLEETLFSNLSDILHQTLKDHDLIEPLRRTILIGNINYNGKQKILKCFNDGIEKIQEEIADQESRLTGILIMHENFFYVMAESSDETLSEVIKTTAKFVGNNLLYGAKVIRSCTIMDRYFSVWNSCVINTPSYVDSNEKIELNQEKSSVLQVAEMVKKLEDVFFVLASYIRFIKPNEFESKINELLPTGVLVFTEELIKLYKEPFFLTTEQYVQFYLKPHDYTSYLEEEWPPTGPIHDCAKYFEEIDEFERDIVEAVQAEEKKQKRRKVLRMARMKINAAAAFKHA